MVRRWGRFFSRVRHRGVLDRERVPDRCNSSGAAVDVCSDTPAWAQRAESAEDGGVVDVARASLCRRVHRELLRSVWLDVTLIIAVTACYQRNYVERYSRYKLKQFRRIATRYEQRSHTFLAFIHLVAAWISI